MTDKQNIPSRATPRQLGEKRLEKSIQAAPESRHSNEDIAALLYELRQEHRDLDQAIAALSTNSGADQIRISRLKKRKLYLKDQIGYWLSKQIPDLNA